MHVEGIVVQPIFWTFKLQLVAMQNLKLTAAPELELTTILVKTMR